MSKLVRDNTPAILADQDPQIAFEMADAGLRVPLLIGKFLEEVGELLIAETREQRLKELGDLQEVIWAYAKFAEISEMEVAMQAASKRSARGEFDDLMTMKVTTKDERPKVPQSSPKPPESTYWNYHNVGGVGYSG